MTDPSIIFQRTHAGREEIHNKSHGLTQSERLVLIMVDGISSYQEIRAKLPVLTDERIDRAVQKLCLKELVMEVLMPLEGQTPDELERSVIDRFLQQDPMDPVTIILHDTEEGMDMLDRIERTTTKSTVKKCVPPSSPAANQVVMDEDVPLLVVPASVPSRVNAAEPALDAHHARLADSLAAEFRAKRALKPLSATRPDHTPGPSHVLFDAGPELSPFLAVHWGYWMIVSGLSFILGFALARITS